MDPAELQPFAIPWITHDRAFRVENERVVMVCSCSNRVELDADPTPAEVVAASESCAEYMAHYGEEPDDA